MQLTDEDVKISLRKIQDDLDSLRDLVKGDGSFLNPGIVGVLERTAKLTEQNTTFLARLKWTTGGIALGGSMLGGGVVAVLARLMGA